MPARLKNIYSREFNTSLGIILTDFGIQQLYIFKETCSYKIGILLYFIIHDEHAKKSSFQHLTFAWKIYCKLILCGNKKILYINGKLDILVLKLYIVFLKG